MKLCALVYLDPASLADAERLAERFALPCVDGSSVAALKPKFLQGFIAKLVPGGEHGFVFVIGPDGLALHTVGAHDGVSIRANFHGPSATFRRKQGGAGGR